MANNNLPNVCRKVILRMIFIVVFMSFRETLCSYLLFSILSKILTVHHNIIFNSCCVTYVIFFSITGRSWLSIRKPTSSQISSLLYHPMPTSKSSLHSWCEALEKKYLPRMHYNWISLKVNNALAEKTNVNHWENNANSIQWF